MAPVVFTLGMDDMKGTVMETTTTTPAPKKGLAITGFALSVCGVISGWCPFTYIVGIILGALGLIFGACGWRNGLGKAGVIIGIVAIVSSILCLVFFVAGVAAAASDPSLWTE